MPKHKLCFKCLVLMLTMFLCTYSFAQKQRRLTFNSYNSLGIVSGKLPLAFTAQTENGIGINNWFLGVGVSLDNYYKRTTPLFAAIKKQKVFNNKSLFLYLNAGTNFILNDGENKNMLSATTTKSGFYSDMGAGYKRKLNGKSNVFLSIGWSVKKMHEYSTSFDMYGMPGIFYNQLSLSRIAVSGGFQF